jgi:hypothetical protein
MQHKATTAHITAVVRRNILSPRTRVPAISSGVVCAVQRRRRVDKWVRTDAHVGSFVYDSLAQPPQRQKRFFQEGRMAAMAGDHAAAGS